MTSGRHKNYYWIEWGQLSLKDLLGRVPDIVLDRCLVNTSFDSGSLMLSDEEREQGWCSTGVVTYSPRISDVLSIPSDQFDEWLVFSQPADVQDWKPFVNYCGLSLTDPQYASLQTELWEQIERVRPESYLADGDRLIFITQNQHLYELSSAQGDFGAAAS